MWGITSSVNCGVFIRYTIPDFTCWGNWRQKKKKKRFVQGESWFMTTSESLNLGQDFWSLHPWCGPQDALLINFIFALVIFFNITKKVVLTRNTIFLGSNILLICVILQNLMKWFPHSSYFKWYHLLLLICKLEDDAIFNYFKWITSRILETHCKRREKGWMDRWTDG